MGTIDTTQAQADTTPESVRRTTRRTVLRGAGVVGAAAVVATLAGCDAGGSGDPSAASGSTNDVNIAKSSDIPVGGGVIFTRQLVVVTQPTAGQFKAFSAVCTHAGCTVGAISGGLIMCPCHGSEYSISDGSVKRAAIQGQQPLPSKTVTVTNGEISVS
jgi:nitrite reductase/ring-hydroxylating ferredoxin subunit